MKKLSILLALGFILMNSLPSNAQLLNTKLQVLVMNDLGNAVEGAKVSLYKTQADYDKSENAVQTGETNGKGKVSFKKLEPTAYFMHVEKGELTNIGRGVKTTKLVAKKKNRLNVVIE